MANSSQSGNILGYASGTQPGLVSTTAQTFAGKKTLDGGALIKGDTSGASVPSGYIGEIIQIKRTAVTGQNINVINQFFNVYIDTTVPTNATLNLTSGGIWHISGTCYAGGSVSNTDVSRSFAISEYSGNTTTDHVLSENAVYFTIPTVAADGIAYFNFVKQYSSAKTLYLKVSLGVTSANSVFRFTLRAIRIGV